MQDRESDQDIGGDFFSLFKEKKRGIYVETKQGHPL